jgi:serine/threonine-protein kinase
MQYKQSQKSVKQIGSELGVDSILEGSVRRDGGKIRILTNLIDAKSDRNIWSRSFEGDAKDILRLQNQLARELSQELMAKLTPAESQRLSSSRSILPEAYDAYLRGISLERKEDYSKESLTKEITLLKQAVELEPNFAIAFASLSRAHACMHQFGFEPGKDHSSEAKKAADRALEIDPDLPEANLSLGYYYYWCMKDYDRALNHFGIARKALPNNVGVLEGISYVQRRQGNCESALNGLKKALVLSPRDLRIATEIANTLSMLRKYKEADSYYASAIGLGPDQISPYLYRIENYYLWDGKTDRAKMLFESLPPTDDNIDYYWIRQNFYSKNYAETISRIKSTPIKIFDNQFGFIPKDLLLGSAYRLSKQPQQANLHYEKAKEILESNLALKPDDPRILSSLGLVYAALGQIDPAIEKGRLGAEVVPLEKNYVEGIFRGMDLAKIYVIIGRKDDALDRLERLLAKPGFLSIRLIELDPDFEPLQHLPRFRKLSERPKSL